MTSFGDLQYRFWDRTSDYLVQPPLTDDMLRRAEGTLGVRLPTSYVTLLRLQNGGIVSPDLNACPTSTRTSWAHDHVPFDECWGIGQDDHGSITGSPNLNREWGQPDELVLLTGDGHWWIALDYRGITHNDPPVVWYDNEMNEDVRLGRTFRGFVEALRPRSVFSDDV